VINSCVWRVAFGALLILAAACTRTPVASSTPASVPHDPSSYANTDAFVTTHILLDLTADFDARTLSGTAELAVERRTADAGELVLDTRDLTIRSVETAGKSGPWSSAAFRLDGATPAFGSALHITMPREAERVRIAYSTSPSAKGLQWLAPAQTAGKKQPFLFSQAQAIQARSFVPLQDLPGVRITYDATIRTPKELVAVMAAEMKPGEAGSGVFHFRMPQPIPSYLIALAIGDLVFKPLSDRTGVWAEPSMIDAAAREFEDTEKMMKTAEGLYGPYRWGRYDLLVLPPSFPFGGMENPRLTFATPTVIVGDKSLVSLVAHELAHSWSGNLVTNATWKDFWLNEGFTTYLERRIVEVLYGASFSRMEAAIGVRDLAEDRAVAEQPGDKTLQPDIAGRDPDDASSRVPYEQGALFLVFLESKFGRDAFDTFLRRWFDEHAFKSATTQEFLSFLKTHLLSTKPGAVTDAQLEEWLHTEGVPAFAVLPSSDAFAKVEQARDAWLGGQPIGPLAKTAATWSTQEWLHFIDTMPRKMDAARLTSLDRQFTLTESQNAEIAHAWYRLAIANRYTAAYPAMERYMIRIGRRKLVVPLYRDLASTPEGRPLATAIYEKARGGYHAMTRDGVEAAMRRAAS
jgi:leukotriene-A4 hydrolase